MSSEARTDRRRPTLIAYRGLWDRHAAPDSLEAIKRAYLRGIPCVLRSNAAELDTDAVLAVVCDPNINRRGQPIFRRYAQDDQAALPPVSRWDGQGWNVVGVYIPAGHPVAGLQPDHFCALQKVTAPVALVEAENVLPRNARRQCVADDDVLDVVRTLVGESVALARVSDLVELDQLDRQRSIACR